MNSHTDYFSNCLKYQGDIDLSSEGMLYNYKSEFKYLQLLMYNCSLDTLLPSDPMLLFQLLDFLKMEDIFKNAVEIFHFNCSKTRYEALLAFNVVDIKSIRHYSAEEKDKYIDHISHINPYVSIDGETYSDDEDKISFYPAFLKSVVKHSKQCYGRVYFNYHGDSLASYINNDVASRFIMDLIEYNNNPNNKKIMFIDECDGLYK